MITKSLGTQCKTRTTKIIMFWRQIIKHFRDEARILYNFSPSDFAVFPKSLKNRPLPRLKKKDEKNPGGVITRDGSG